MLSESQKEAFARDGYLITRGTISPEELTVLREHAESLQAKVKSTLPDGVRFWYGGSQRKRDIPRERLADATWGVNEITRQSLFDPVLVDVLGHPVFDGITRDLLGPNPRAWGIKMLWAPLTHDYDLKWHRDQLKHDLYDWIHHKPAANDHVQYNAALYHDDAFIVVPGSHRRPLTEEEWYAIRHEPQAELPGELVADLEPGDVVWMDAHALHRGRTKADSGRLTLHYSAQADWVPLLPWGSPEDFAWITSDAFIEQLSPETRPYYQALREAELTEDAMSFVKAAATAAGWAGPSESE